MPYHTVAFAENADHANLTNVNVVTDGVLTIPNADEVEPEEPFTQLLGGIVGSPSITRARLQQLSLRGTYPDQGPDLWPLNQNAEPLSPLPWIDYRDNPLPLKPRQALSLQVEHDAGVAEDMWALLFLGSVQRGQQVNNARWFRFSTTTNIGAAEDWSEITDLAPTQQLDDNTRYDIVGGVFVQDGGTLRAVRFPNLDPPGSSGATPGNPGLPAFDAPEDVPAVQDYPFVDGRMGALGSFVGGNDLTFEAFADTADATEIQAFLQLVPRGTAGG